MNRKVLLGNVAILGIVVGMLVAQWFSQNRLLERGSGARKDFSWLRPKSLGKVVPPAIQKQIREADYVHAYLISSYLDAGSDVGPRGSVRGYQVRSDPAILSKAQTKRLRKTLLDRQSYQVQGKKCEFTPSVAYVFTTTRDSTTVLISHICDQLEIFSAKESSHGEVDPAAEVFVGITHELFPGDTLVTGIWQRKPNERWWLEDGSAD